MLMPVLAAGVAWAIWTGRTGARAWLAIVALQGLLVGSSLVAINTGSAEEERVEAVVPEHAIHQHEEFAEQFAWASGAACVLSALVLFGRRSAVSHALTATAVAATVAVAALGLRVGHAGGQLVYTHNAAAAYALATTDPNAAPPVLERGDRDDDTPRRTEGRRR
jgi:xanthosine utilization system XapX-like protein